MNEIQIIIIGNISFAVTAFSYLMKDIVLLRVIAILSCFLGVIYNFFAAQEPLWLVIFWLSIFMIINLYQIINILKGTRKVNFSDKELEIRNNFFSQLSLEQFKKILELSSCQTFPEKACIITKNQPVPELKFILSGAVNVRDKNTILASLKAGSFIGEVSFTSGSRATADVIAAEETNVISWDQSSLRKLLISNPSLHLIFTRLINSDLTQKLGFK